MGLKRSDGGQYLAGSALFSMHTLPAAAGGAGQAAAMPVYNRGGHQKAARQKVQRAEVDVATRNSWALLTGRKASSQMR